METAVPPGRFVGSISLDQAIEILRQDIATKQQQLATLEAVRGNSLSPAAGSIPRLAVKGNGKLVQPKDPLVRILRENNDEMPANELFDLLKAEGVFDGKKRPPSAFRTSLSQNFNAGTITIIHATRGPVKKAVRTEKFSAFTVRLGDGRPFFWKEPPGSKL